MIRLRSPNQSFPLRGPGGKSPPKRWFEEWVRIVAGMRERDEKTCEFPPLERRVDAILRAKVGSGPIPRGSDSSLSRFHRANQLQS
jgi:hypothetical protein